MKKRNLFVKISSVVISLVLIAAMALCMTSCGKTESPADTSSVEQSQTVKSEIKFSVVGADGEKKEYAISTDKKMLGDALVEEGIILESENETGFINTVNGVTLDWNTDKAYWALYVGENYAEKGVNETEITDGGEYSFVYTKG